LIEGKALFVGKKVSLSFHK
jgi:hypothetical protein